MAAMTNTSNGMPNGTPDAGSSIHDPQHQAVISAGNAQQESKVDN